MNGDPIREMRILPPEQSIVFTPSKKMGNIFDGPAIKATGKVSFRREMNKRFFIPSDNFDIKAPGDPKKEQTTDRALPLHRRAAVWDPARAPGFLPESIIKVFGQSYRG